MRRPFVPRSMQDISRTLLTPFLSEGFEKRSITEWNFFFLHSTRHLQNSLPLENKRFCECRCKSCSDRDNRRLQNNGTENRGPLEGSGHLGFLCYSAGLLDRLHSHDTGIPIDCFKRCRRTVFSQAGLYSGLYE